MLYENFKNMTCTQSVYNCNGGVGFFWLECNRLRATGKLQRNTCSSNFVCRYLYKSDR
jgi:hypothetical protein